MNTQQKKSRLYGRGRLRPRRDIVFLVLSLLLAGLAGAHSPAPAQDATTPVAPAPDVTFIRGEPLPGRMSEATAVRQPPARGADSPPEGVDLDVTFIRRTPPYHYYCVVYDGGLPDLCPGTEGERRWPEPGETVTFTAHIVNKGTQPSSGFDYNWRLDETAVHTGSLPALAPGAMITTTYSWPWGHTMDGERVVDDHTIGLVVDPLDAIAETYEINNALTDRTNALALRLAITPEMMAAYDVPWDPAFSYSAEDWLQRQIAALNGALAGSVYPVTPAGATERVRIDRIEVTAAPPINDGTADGGWFVDADYRIVSGGYDPVADVDWNLVHELSHQLGLIDLYNSNVARNSVEPVDGNGMPVNFAFTWPRPGLMGGGDTAPHYDTHLYSSHTAGAISANKGYRRGYYGEYQFDLPADNYLLLLDNAGDPAAGVSVALFQRNGERDWTGAPAIDSTPEVTGTTDLDGRLWLANRSVGGGATTRTGHTLSDNPFGVVDVVGQQNRFLMRLSQGTHEEFHWLDITHFNLAYWQGDVVSHTITLDTHIPPAAAPPAPGPTTAVVEGDDVTLCWPVANAPALLGYNVYRAAPPEFEYTRIEELIPGPCDSDINAGESRVYAVTAVDTAGRESGFGNFVFVPSLRRPADVALEPGGQRLILDPQNGYALLRQQGDGRYWQNIGSPHFHLENSHYLDIDPLGRLIISHPGDWYTSRHSVRIADSEATPLLEFGQRGSGPGEFETPTGVAAWGDPCTIEGPYDVDPHALLLLHLDGSYDGAQGEVGAPMGTTFVPGRYDQGVMVDNDDTLTYGSSGNFNREAGAIEMWLRPEWPGGDFNSYTFFEIGTGWFNRMRLMKDGANNLRFMVWDSTTEYGIATHVAHWPAGEWHHIAATWTGTNMTLYVDGQGVASRDDARPPDVLGPTIYVGSSYLSNQQAEATIDEVRISDIPRVGNSDSCSYRIVVADGGNSRLQAFDALGNFVTEFGGPGSGPGQFNWPRGLAVDGQGDIIVADSGNDRLQRLAFDGHTFAHAATYEADLLSPYNVAVDATDHIVVADTGHNLVKVLNSNGVWLATYAGPDPPYSGLFDIPQGVAVDDDGTIIVADTGRQRVVTIGRAPLTERFYLPAIIAPDSGVCTDLIVNGGFETDAAWHLNATAYPAVISDEQAYTGLRSLRTGIVDPGDNVFSYSSAYQALTLPGNATQATLELWHYPLRVPGPLAGDGRWTITDHFLTPAGPQNGDAQYFLVLDADGRPLETLFWAQRDDGEWLVEQFDLLSYAGRSIRLLIGTYNDGGGAVTAQFVDDVSLITCTP